MKRRIMWSVLTLLFTLSMAYNVSFWAQGRGQNATAAKGRPAPGKMSDVFEYIPKSDLDALRALGGDRPARVLNMGGKYHLGVFSLPYEPRKPKPGEPLLELLSQRGLGSLFCNPGSGNSRAWG